MVRKAAAAQRQPRAPQLLQEALCAAPATRKAAAAQRPRSGAVIGSCDELSCDEWMVRIGAVMS